MSVSVCMRVYVVCEPTRRRSVLVCVCCVCGKHKGESAVYGQ